MNKFMKNTTGNNYGSLTVYLEYEDIVNNNANDCNLDIAYNTKTRITANNITSILCQTVIFCYQKDIEEASLLQDISYEEHNILATVYKKDAWTYYVDMYGWGRQQINVYDLLKNDEEEDFYED